MNIGLSAEDIVTILGAGLAGLAFLFVVLSYMLLRKEQDRSGEPRGEMLKHINRFTYSTLAFAIVVALSTLFTSNSDDVTVSDACVQQLERSRVLIDSEQHTMATIRQLLITTLNICDNRY